MRYTILNIYYYIIRGDGSNDFDPRLRKVRARVRSLRGEGGGANDRHGTCPESVFKEW